MRFFLLSLTIVLLFSACATRPTPLPEAHSKKLPWGAIDLDINSLDKCSIKNSLGTVLTQKHKGTAM